jgi:hypothetical protein
MCDSPHNPVEKPYRWAMAPREQHSAYTINGKLDVVKRFATLFWKRRVEKFFRAPSKPLTNMSV